MQVYGNGVNSTGGSNVQTFFFDRKGVMAANVINVYQQFCDKSHMQPQGNGKSFKISKILNIYDRKVGDADFASKGYLTGRSVAELNAKITASTLSEGAGAVNEKVVERQNFEVSLARYGGMIKYTDEVEMFSDMLVQVEYREKLAGDANVLMEDLLQMDMLGSPTVMYTGAATSMSTIGTGVAADGTNDSMYKMSYDDVRRSGRILKRNRAKKVNEIVKGSTSVGTTPVPQAWYAIIDPSVKADLEVVKDSSGELAWVPVHKYGNTNTVAEGEVGAIHETRFIESETAAVYRGAGAEVPAGYTGTLQYTNVGGVNKFDVFPIIYPSKEAFASIGLKGKDKIKFNAKAPGEIELNNPYGTQGFFSYNFFYAGLILAPEKLLIVKTAASK